MSGELGVSPTFTDRDLYDMMGRHLPSIFWPTWEAAGQSLRACVAELANEIYGRLCGSEQPREKPAGTESAGSERLPYGQPCEDCGAPTDEGHHL